MVVSRWSGSDPDARDKGGTGSRNDARKMHRGLPIAHPFEVEQIHGGTSTEFVGSVVTDLDDVTGFVSTEEDRLRLGKVLHKEIGVLPLRRSFFLDCGKNSLSRSRSPLNPEAESRAPTIEKGIVRLVSLPKIIKVIVHKINFLKVLSLVLVPYSLHSWTRTGTFSFYSFLVLFSFCSFCLHSSLFALRR